MANVSLTDEFDHPQGMFENYDAYTSENRLQLLKQRHADIRSFADDEEWTAGTVGAQPDRNHWRGISLTCPSNTTTTATSIIHKGPANDVDSIDAKTNIDDDAVFSVALPAFPLASIDLTQSWIDLTSEPDGSFSGSTVSLRLDSSDIPLVAGDSEFRRPVSALAPVDTQFISGVRFRIHATANTTFRALAVRILDSGWRYTQIDTDTRLGYLKPTVAPNGKITQPYQWTLPTLYRAGQPVGVRDPKPINMSVAVVFFTGSQDAINTINLNFRETAVNYMNLIELEGTPLSELEGKPLPEISSNPYRLRTQDELDQLVQSDLNFDTQIEIERVPDPDFSSFIQARLQWDTNVLNLRLEDSDGAGYTLGSELPQGLLNNAWYIFIVDLEETTMRARIYPLDESGNLVLDEIVYDTGTINDEFIFVRRAGRFGWSVSFGDGDAMLESVRIRNQVYAALETQAFESITPVDGCELTAIAADPYEYFDSLYPTDDPATTVSIIRDRNRSTTGISNRVMDPGTDDDQGIQTNLMDFYNFGQMEIKFDVYYPKTAHDAGGSLKAYLSNDAGRVIQLQMPKVLPDRWQSIRIEPGHPAAQTGRYRLFVVQDGTYATTWWIDNVHVTERSVSFYGRSVREDPWGDAKIDWVPFKNHHSKLSSGVQFLQRGRFLQIRAEAHRQDSYIESIHAEPRYAHLGRLVWEEDEWYTPQPPVASFSADQNNLEVTFGGLNSVDNDGEVVNYQWAFGDGATAFGPVVTHKYPRPGQYVASLIVTDKQGLQGQTSQDLFVTIA